MFPFQHVWCAIVQWGRSENSRFYHSPVWATWLSWACQVWWEIGWMYSIKRAQYRQKKVAKSSQTFKSSFFWVTWWKFTLVPVLSQQTYSYLLIWAGEVPDKVFVCPTYLVVIYPDVTRMTQKWSYHKTWSVFPHNLEKKTWKYNFEFFIKTEKKIQDPTAITFLSFQLSVMKHIYYLWTALVKGKSCNSWRRMISGYERL